MVSSQIPKEVVLSESVEEDFFKDDFKVSDKLPALYEKQCKISSGRGKLTPERYEAIIRYVKSGACLNHAAYAVGIDEQTLFSWLKRGAEEPDGLYGIFLDDFNRAKSMSIIRNVGIVQRAASDDWTAAKWLLTVLEPDVYGNKSTVKTEISGPGGEELKTEIVISDEELRKLTAIQMMIDKQNEVVDVDYTIVDEDNETV